MKSSNQQPFDLVIIEWLDSSRAFDWQPLEDVERPAPVVCFSVGWVVKKNKEAVLVVPHISHPNGLAVHQGCGGMSIPRCSIARITTLEKAR